MRGARRLQPRSRLRQVDPEVAACGRASRRARSPALGAHVEDVDPRLRRPARGAADAVVGRAARIVLSGFPPDNVRCRPRLATVAAAGRAIALAATYLRRRQARRRSATRWPLPHGVRPAADADDADPARLRGRTATCPRRPTSTGIDWTPFSYPFNLTRQPAATIPCGLTAAGLPIGLQIVGPRYADALVLRAARAYEAARPQPSYRR